MKTHYKENVGYVLAIHYGDHRGVPFYTQMRTEHICPETGDLVDYELSRSAHHDSYVEAYDHVRAEKELLEITHAPIERDIIIDDAVLLNEEPFIPIEIKRARNVMRTHALLAWVHKLTAGSLVGVFSNQAEREGKVLAVLPPRGSKYGGLPRILIEYTMPRGSTALFTIGCGDISYSGLAKHKQWLHAIKTQTGYEGHTLTTKAEGRDGNEREGTIEILPICGQSQGGATWCFPVNPPIYLGGNGTEGNENREKKYPVTNRKYKNIDYSNWGFDYNRVNWDSVSEESNPWVARAQDFS
tara:strand:+ start:6058 stop:6954 length:897 start_codon:yes stop_codon:yes gene_type:complete